MEQHQQAAEKAGKWWTHGCRYGGQRFFHYAGTPKAEEENRRIEKVLETENPAQERKLLLLRPYKTLTGDQVEAMTDQQIIDRAPELERFLSLYSLEMPEMDPESLSEEQRQEFRELQAKKGVFDMLGGRMEMIVNPNYEFFRLESLLHINKQAIEEKYPRTRNDRV